MWTTSSDNPQRLGSIPSSESCSIFGVTIISNLLDRLTTSLAVCTILHPPVKPWRWFPIARCQSRIYQDIGELFAALDGVMAERGWHPTESNRISWALWNGLDSSRWILDYL